MTCKDCIWCDPYLDHDYGFCDEKADMGGRKEDV